MLNTIPFRCFCPCSSHTFFQHVRSEFSTRALESKKIATLFQVKNRRFLDRKSDAFFWPLFGRFEKHVRTPLTISALQRQFLPAKFARKLRLFQPFLFPSNSRSVAIYWLQMQGKTALNNLTISLHPFISRHLSVQEHNLLFICTPLFFLLPLPMQR